MFLLLFVLFSLSTCVTRRFYSVHFFSFTLSRSFSSMYLLCLRQCVCICSGCVLVLMRFVCRLLEFCVFIIISLTVPPVLSFWFPFIAWSLCFSYALAYPSSSRSNMPSIVWFLLWQKFALFFHLFSSACACLPRSLMWNVCIMARAPCLLLFAASTSSSFVVVVVCFPPFKFNIHFWFAT